MKLSIIIPTLNEEKCLLVLFESIKKQVPFGFDYEIIVADAGSRDKTIDIAKKYNCVVTNGGLPGPGKNRGAEKAKGDLLLFLDADSFLAENFLKNSLEEFERKKFKTATFLMRPFKKNNVFLCLLNIFYNWPIIFLEKFLPHAAMAILMEREVFEKIKGFDETIKIAEDHDLARRAKKIGKFGIIKSAELFVSDRRFKKDGWVRTYLKFLFCELHMIFLGPVRSNIFKYQFDHYSKEKGKQI